MLLFGGEFSSPDLRKGSARKGARRRRACGAFVHIEFELVITYRKHERDVIANLQGLHPERGLTDQSPADA
jgi:hypothetical protein